MYGHFELIKSSHAYSELLRDCKEGLIKHSYVFESSDFVSLNALSAAFISIAERGEYNEQFIKRYYDGGFLDVIFFPSPEKNGKIDVDDAAYITDTAYLTPTELTAKYYIIAAEGGLSPAVQNKLLKTLEEPPESARFIIFSRGGDLLATVKSRCGAVRLEEFSVDSVKNELISKGADEVTALFAAAVSRGSIGSADEIAKDKSYRLAYETAVNFLLNAKRSTQILPYASEMIAFKDKIGAVIDYLELIMRDIIAFNAIGASAVVLKPAVSDIINLSHEFNNEICLNVMPLFTRARERIKLYGNTASIVDELLFSILEVKAKCPK